MEFAPNPDQENFILMLQEAMRRAYVSEDPTSVREWLQRQLLLGQPRDVEAKLQWAASFDLYREILASRAEHSMLPADQRREFTWGWESWNRYIESPDDGALALIAGAPGTGKTVVAEHIAEANAQAGGWGLFFHYELSRKVMLDRRAIRQTMGRLQRPLLRKGILTEEQIARLTEDSEGGRLDAAGIEWERLSREARWELGETEKRMKDWKGGLDYMHVPGWSVDQLIDTVSTEFEARKGTAQALSFIIVDYLEKIAPSPRQIKTYGTNSLLREGDIIEGIKNLAERTGLTIVLFAQLNKAGRQNSGDMDGTEVKGAGDKTEKTNIVNILRVEDDLDGEPTLLKNHLVKNTMGRTGTWTQKRLGDRFDIADMVEF